MALEVDEAPLEFPVQAVVVVQQALDSRYGCLLVPSEALKQLLSARLVQRALLPPPITHTVQTVGTLPQQP